jgi:hypothetical protein
MAGQTKGKRNRPVFDSPQKGLSEKVSKIAKKLQQLSPVAVAESHARNQGSSNPRSSSSSSSSSSSLDFFPHRSQETVKVSAENSIMAKGDKRKKL